MLLEPYYREQHPHDYSCEYEVIKLGIRRLGDGGVRGRVANRGREDTTGGDGEEEPPLRFTAAILQMLFTEPVFE